MTSHPLSFYLKREHNNFDLMRMLMALAVIIHHAPTLAQIPMDILYVNPLGLNFGDTAVAFFFFLSGLVVTNSFLSRPSFIYYTTSRFFRIWPALFCVLMISVFIIGPLVSKLALSDYFSQKESYQYIFYNLKMKPRYILSGIFENNLLNASINGSLWTIKWEVKAYTFLFFLLYIPLQLNKKSFIGTLTILLFLTMLFSGVIDQVVFKELISAKPFFVLFFLGALFCLLKEQIKINRFTFGLSLILFSVSCYFKYFYTIQLLSVSLVLMHIAFYPAVLKLKPKYDISFGVYIWAFPIAQTIEYYLPNLNLGINIMIVMCFSLLAGYLSWIYIEKSCMSYGKNVADFLTRRYQCYNHTKN